MRLIRVFLAVLVTLLTAHGVASAQAMFTASIGNVFGGSAPSKKNVWSIALGGGGAHHIGSELEYSETRKFFERADGTSHGKVVTLMPSIFVAVPAGAFRPYGIFGFGFIRQRPEGSGGLFSDLSDDDIGYAIGGGVIFKFAPSAGVRADLRHFKVRTSDGISFRRFLVGLVLGG